jgi:hypothetical protein
MPDICWNVVIDKKYLNLYAWMNITFNTYTCTHICIFRFAYIPGNQCWKEGSLIVQSIFTSWKTRHVHLNLYIPVSICKSSHLCTKKKYKSFKNLLSPYSKEMKITLARHNQASALILHHLELYWGHMEWILN